MAIDDEQIKKMWCIYNGILFNHKKGNPAFCDNMDEPVMLSEISETKTVTVWTHLYVKPKKKNPQQQQPNRTENRLVVA